MHEPPDKLEIDVPAWAPALVQQYLDDTYDAKYSIPSCWWVLNKARLSYQKPRRTTADSDSEDEERIQEKHNKRGGRWMPS
ncbi:winged helix-turn-helix domain-containing protein [Saliphagus sp. LR7]|uniref:winged helix-turn-helix domain-containing protein n=1 Tax=Saliphagus sp. LR7 TaxID=2282654 RepID=UPI000DF7F584